MTVKGHELQNSVTNNIVAIIHSLNNVSFINVTYDSCITLRVPVAMKTLKLLRRQQVYLYTKKIISKLREKYNNVIIIIIWYSAIMSKYYDSSAGMIKYGHLYQKCVKILNLLYLTMVICNWHLPTYGIILIEGYNV